MVAKTELVCRPWYMLQPRYYGDEPSSESSATANRIDPQDRAVRGHKKQTFVEICIVARCNFI